MSGRRDAGKCSVVLRVTVTVPLLEGMAPDVPTIEE